MIGNNIVFGTDVIVLKGVEIGDNCIIGAGSIVSNSIPANSVAVGRPAKVVCSIDEFYERRKRECVKEAYEYANSIIERFNREPKYEEFYEEFHLFIDSHNIDKYPKSAARRQLGEKYEYWLRTHKAPFSDFNEFLKAAKRYKTNQ